MNISLDNMQQTLNLILFSACVVLVPSFQNVQKKNGKTKNSVVFECSRNHVLESKSTLKLEAFTAKGI